MPSTCCHELSVVSGDGSSISATEYLEYLENMAQGIRTYLHKFEEHYQQGGVSEKKTYSKRMKRKRTLQILRKRPMLLETI